MINFWAACITQDCILCAARAGEAPVCRACAEALPRPGPACERCGAPLPQAGVTCGECLRRPPAFDALTAAFAYAFPVDRLVLRFKFAGDLAVGRWLAGELARRVACADRPALLVATPLTRARLRERGFNQALEVAKHVGAELGVPVALAAVEKVRDTAPQARLGPGERRANLEGAFRARRRFTGEPIGVVDDVVTTGTTVEGVARALRDAGAGRISVWALARTPPPAR